MIANELLKVKNLMVGNPCSDTDIKEAEATLKLKLGEEYKEYVKAFGRVNVYGRNWCGLNCEPEFNAVKATMDARKAYGDKIPSNMIVLRKLKDSMICVDENDIVYEYGSIREGEIVDQMFKYIDLCKRR